MKFVGLVMAFMAILILGFLALGYMGTQTPPSNTTQAGQQYENLTRTVDISYTGINGGLLLLLVAFVLAALWMIIKVVK